jgi:transposase
MAFHMRSIKGMGPIFVAAILAGAGDLRQYAHGRQLLRKAGLNLAESTSGKRKGQIVISKRGDSRLRKYLYLATIQLIGINPVFQELHQHNVQVKHMKKQQSVFKLVGKVARVLIGMVHRAETFTPEKASHLVLPAA